MENVPLVWFLIKSSNKDKFKVVLIFNLACSGVAYIITYSVGINILKVLKNQHSATTTFGTPR